MIRTWIAMCGGVTFVATFQVRTFLTLIIFEQAETNQNQKQITVNLYRTGLYFSVRVHGTEFPFKSLRVFDSKRLYLVNRRRRNNEII